MLRSRQLLPRLLQRAAAASGRPAAPAAAAAQRAAASSSTAGGAGQAAAVAAEAAAGFKGQRMLALTALLGAGAAAGAAAYASGGAASCEAPAADAGAVPKGGAAGAAAGRRKTRIVVLGSGWGAVSFLKNLDAKACGPNGRYEVIVVSPRSYFLYTPLLLSAAAGSVQEHSIMQPIRNVLAGQGEFFQAEAVAIDPERRTVTCRVDPCAVCRTLESEGRGGAHTHAHGAAPAAPAPAAPKAPWWPWGRGKGGGAATAAAAPADTFELPYDVLIVGVGSVNNTFGIPGVREHCYFMKSIQDAHALRTRISKVIEHAGLPHLSEAERRRHLNFVVVGGGPTGVELAAELHDFVQEDVARLMPHVKDEVRITVVDTMDHLLGAFDRELSEYTASHFKRAGIDVQLGTMVRAVSDGALTVTRSGNGGAEETLPFGTCVWATGIAMHPLVARLKADLQRQLSDVQNARTGLVVDGHLRVKGTRGTIYCLGDAAVTHQERALENAAQLFASADADGDQRLSRAEIVAMLRKVRGAYPQMGELAQLLDEGVLERAARGVWGTSTKPGRYTKHIERLGQGLTYEEFQELLADADTLMRSLPPTAQVAAQEGKYLARLFSAHPVAPYPGPPPPAAGPGIRLAGGVWVPVPAGAAPFEYRHMGSFAYVGMDEAILSLPASWPFSALRGWLIGLSWRGFETWGQVSARNKWMVQSDWLRTKLFGRNLSEA